MSEPTQSIGLNEAADELGVHYMTVYRHVRTGLLPAERLPSGWSISRTDLDAYRARGKGMPAIERQQQIEERLRQGDDAAVWTIVESVLASAMPVSSIIGDLLIPSMRSIGDRWAAGELTVLEEHRASSAMSVVLSRLSPHTARVEVRGKPVVVATPANDTHGLAAWLLAELLRAHGHPVIELGAATPPESFAEVTREKSPVAVVVTMYRVDDDVPDMIIETIEAIRAANPSTYIALGGPGIDQLGGHDIAADAMHNDFPRLIDDLKALEQGTLNPSTS